MRAAVDAADESTDDEEDDDDVESRNSSQDENPVSSTGFNGKHHRHQETWC